MKHLLPLALACVTLPVYAQTPQPAPPPAQPGVQVPPSAGDSRNASESSRVSHLVAGPDGRPQGLLLRNGTFVVLSPGLAQQMPATVRRNTPVQVRGVEYSGKGEKTIQAQNLLIAGVSYSDALGTPGMRAAAGIPAPPPPPPGAPRGAGAVPPPPPPAPRGPGAAGAPGAMPPPPPCGNSAAPPPPAPNTPAAAAPATPPPAGASAPVPPPAGGAPAGQPGKTGVNPR